MTTRYFIGLDLGQAGDFSALAVLERPTAPRERSEYSVRHLRRFPLGTPYTDVVPAVAELAGAPPLAGACLLAVDQTGVGRPVVDMLRQQPVPATVVPVTITAGHAATVGPDGSAHVPKKELVSRLQVLLEGRRLKVARRLPDADVLVRELEHFRVKVTSAANEVFGAWGQGKHDDLVVAVALAAWAGESEVPPYLGPLSYNSWAPWPPDSPRVADASKPAWRHVLEDLGIDLEGDW
jgi:hypothetical protein